MFAFSHISSGPTGTEAQCFDAASRTFSHAFGTLPVSFRQVMNGSWSSPNRRAGMSDREPTGALDSQGKPEQEEADFNERYVQLTHTIHRDLVGENPSDLDRKRSTVALGLLAGSLSWLGSVHGEPILALADRISLIKAVVEELEWLVVPEVIRHDRAEKSDDTPTGLIADFTALIGADPDTPSSPGETSSIARKMLGLDDPEMVESFRSYIQARAKTRARR